LEIRLRAGASFQEKLRQLLGKCAAKRAPEAPFRKFLMEIFRYKF
jgi:hypothetical protein